MPNLAKCIDLHSKELSTKDIEQINNYAVKQSDQDAVKAYIRDVDGSRQVEGSIKTSSGRIPVGSFLKDIIELKTSGKGVTADVNTLFHETEHWMEANNIISDNDIKALNTAIGKEDTTSEERADFVGKNLADRHNQKNMRIKRILNKIADFLNAFYEIFSQSRTARGVLADIETGAILSKKELSGINQFAQEVSFSLKDAVAKIKGNPNFDRFFKNSKAVDKNKEPLILYHGTKDNFNVFNKEMLGLNTGHPSATWGFAFTPDKGHAKGYSHIGKKYEKIKPVYLSIVNPKIITFDEYQKIIDKGVAKQFIKTVVNKGHDGVFINPPLEVSKLGHPFRAQYTSGIFEAFAFEPTQIKSIYNSGEFSTDPDIRYQQTAGRFYSQVIKTVQDKMPAKMQASSVMNWLRKQPGVKKAELEWMNIEEMLEGRKLVTKDELVKLLRENEVKVEEVVKRERDLSEDDVKSVESKKEGAGEIWVVTFNNGETIPVVKTQYVGHDVTKPEAVDIALDRFKEDSVSPKFSSYQLPGEKENYRELFLTMPNAKDYSWQDGHSGYSDIKNPIIRVRMNERVDLEGNKTLFIEEIQKPLSDEQPKMPEFAQKNAIEMGLKRIIRMAAEQGIDKVAWISGTQTADRYDLSKQIKDISHAINDKGNYDLVVTTKEGRTEEILNKTTKGLEEYVGKDVAQKIINEEGSVSPASGMFVLSGLDLKIGANWAYALYDKMIPQYLKKFGKKYDASVGTTEINVGNEQQLEQLRRGVVPKEYVEKLQETQQAFTITPELKRAALFEGMPLFQMAGKEALGAPTDALAKAQTMLAEGKSEKEVWKETGWLKGAEKHTWKWEIDDSGAKIKEFKDTSYRIPLENILIHPKLYDAYPELRNVPFTVFSPATNQDSEGMYNKKEGILLNYEHKNNAKEIIVHEVSHAIQRIEGFAKGGSPNIANMTQALWSFFEDKSFEYNKLEKGREKTELKKTLDRLTRNLIDQKTPDPSFVMEAYQRLAGEIEARDAAARAKLTPEQRREQMPYESQDIPKEDWIIIDGSGTSFSVEAAPTDKQFQAKPARDYAALAKKYAEAQKKPIGKPTPTFTKFIKQVIPGFKDNNQKLKYGYDNSRIDGATFDLPEESTLFETFKYNMVNWLDPQKKIQKAIEEATGTIPEYADVLTKEMLRVSKTKSDKDIAEQTHYKPIKRLIGANKLTVDTVDEFLYGRHAQEANARLRLTNAKLKLNDLNKIRDDNDLAKRIKEIDDFFEKNPFSVRQDQYYNLLESELKTPRNEKETKFKERWEHFKSKPSGMADAEAQEIVKKYKGHKALHRIAKQFDAMNDEKLDILLESGRLSQKEYDAIKGTFEYYAPLKREGFDSKPKTGKGIQLLMQDIKVRGGSTKRAVNILANAMADFDATLIKRRKSESARALLELVKLNPNENVWRIETPRKVPGYDAGGNIVLYNDMSVQNNELKIKVDGKLYLISAQNEHSFRVIKGLRGDNFQTGPIVNALSKLNRYLAMINTTLSPEFMINNFARDTGTAFFNLSNTEIAQVKSRVLKDIPKAMKGLRNHLRGDGTQEWAKHAKTYEQSGAKIGWIDFAGDIGQRARKLENEINLFRDGHVTQKKIHALGKLIEDYNTVVENAVRLSTFKNAVDQGVSVSKAALMAKDLTVNFNQKGVYGSLINSLYLFSNAGIQGSAKILSVLKDSPKARKAVYVSMVVATTLAIANSGLGGDDDDGVPYYDKIEDFVKERNIIIMLPGTKGKYVKIPLPWGYNVFWAMGTEVGDMVTQKDYTVTGGMARMITTITGAFNPLQSSTLLQTISPTVTDPFVQIAENKSWSGNPLMPENSPFADVEKPDSELHWASARRASVELAKALNFISGGNQIRPGLMDVSPETLDLVWDTFAGSAGKFAMDTLSLPLTVTEPDIRIKKIPIVRRLMGQKSEYADSAKFRENIAHVYLLRDEIEAYPKRAKDIKKDRTHLLLRSAKMAKAAIRKLNKRLKVATISQENKDNLKNRIRLIQQRFNKRFLEKL